MKIGYPCINRSIGCTTNATFRLANYSEEKLVAKITANLECLKKILEYNVRKGCLFFRISSDVIPFASHPVMTYDWAGAFAETLRSLGGFIRMHGMRISMHPDQFVLLNAIKQDIVAKSKADLAWHCRFLDTMGLGADAKVQIHIGGAYGEREAAIRRFVRHDLALPAFIRKRLVIENDDRVFDLADAMTVHQATGVPVLFDRFHHMCRNRGESVFDAIRMAASTWKEEDGVPMVDYSSQSPGMRLGSHAQHISVEEFTRFLREIGSVDVDIMLEIKDKEKSARRALDIARSLGRM
jgi:UV DNA damage endonuclease